ncbi:hypothetical protein [Aquimarina sp. AU58]|uniref:hypothetical protein n=1 Tax=Aquimarina sp. AU58 TaxID=1874112 RepID=UPI0013577D09|nr:hypothetical protein [Aquimarina sp. AU58]
MTTRIKSSIITISLCTLFTIMSCEKEETDTFFTKENKENLSVESQFINQKEIPISSFTEIQPSSSKGNCTMGSDISCGSDAIRKIKQYITSGCINYSQGQSIQHQTEFTYSYTYYVDSDGDINLDKYKYKFQNHIGGIQGRLMRLYGFREQIVNIGVKNITNPCPRLYGYKTGKITYTIVSGSSR